MAASSIVKKLAPALVASLLVACSNEPAPQPTPLVITPEIFSVTVIVPTDTPVPTPTPLPLAARVNDQPITIDQFNAELERYLSSIPDAPASASNEGMLLEARLKEQVLNALIEQALIEQAAAKEGVSVSDAQISEEITVAVERAGGPEKFNAWASANRMNDQDVREMVKRELLANAMRDRVLSQLPRTAEYIRAYHIVVRTEREAMQALQRLQNGTKFSALAQTVSIDDSTRVDGGDLGWITRNSGALLWSEVEDAAFALPVGETSDIIKSPIGYHIIRVTEKKERPLSEADTAQLQDTALLNWIAQLKAGAKIERFI
jgi:parvulin-like peptidyl-prolyl isomerase